MLKNANIKNIGYITIIIILLFTTIFYWYKADRLSYRLWLIQKRIEESKKVVIEKKKPDNIPTAYPTTSYKGKIAIVIDDWGYNLNNIDKLYDLEIPVTLSILPNLPYSTQIANLANDLGLEVILHLPMEPYEDIRLEKDTIMTSMSDDEIISSLNRAMASIPTLKGISNHMGSRATEDERVMSLIFKTMKERNLYFLDSLVTSKSVCKKLSKHFGVKFTHRSVFLDNNPEPEYIKTQIKELVRQALFTKWAIGVGHDREVTIETLKDMIPYFQQKHIKVVFASELAE